MKQTQPGRATSWLPVMIRLTAVGYLLFFLPDLILASTHHIGALPAAFDRLFKWGEGGDPVAVMFSTVYVIWALYLFRSARAPAGEPTVPRFQPHRELRSLRCHAAHGRHYA